MTESPYSKRRRLDNPFVAASVTSCEYSALASVAETTSSQNSAQFLYNSFSFSTSTYQSASPKSCTVSPSCSRVLMRMWGSPRVGCINFSLFSTFDFSASPKSSLQDRLSTFVQDRLRFQLRIDSRLSVVQLIDSSASFVFGFGTRSSLLDVLECLLHFSVFVMVSFNCICLGSYSVLTPVSPSLFAFVFRAFD